MREDTEAWEALSPLLQAEVVALAPKHHEATRVASSMYTHYGGCVIHTMAVNNASTLSRDAGDALDNATVADYGALRPTKEFIVALQKARVAVRFP